MGTPLIVFTGGDPCSAMISRVDPKCVRAASPLHDRSHAQANARAVMSLRDAGVHQMALSIDAETAEKHDAFRGVPGTFAKVIDAARWIRESGVNLQANAVFGPWNARDFDGMAALIEELGVTFWEVFFLVPTGRGSALQGCTPEEFESLFAKLCELAKRAPFVIKVTEAQHLRRFVAQQSANDPRPPG
jgi:MoaA/NifB/PqqE/SkfB family radical SAM enzyme